jgi:hypothetical protein
MDYQTLSGAGFQPALVCSSTMKSEADWVGPKLPGAAEPCACVLYWTSSMRRFNVIFVLAFLTQPTLYAVEKQYQTATVVEVQQKTNTRVLYYVVDTPITKDEPYYEVSVQLKDMVYLCRYVPRHAQDTLPVEWGSGATVAARVEGRHLFVKRPGGNDVDFVVAKRTAVRLAEKPAGLSLPGK